MLFNKASRQEKKYALIFGYGFIGAAFAEALRAEGYAISATARTADKRAELTTRGITAIDPTDPAALKIAVDQATVILLTAAPNDEGCPAFTALSEHLVSAAAPRRRWIGYLSTTGVYGDRGGGWVFEDSALNPISREGQRRAEAEQQWLNLGQKTGDCVTIFRLPGLYGPGRNVLERLKDGTARRIHKPGQVFSRLYDSDCATALMASVRHPRAGGIYNLCDDEPASADDVLVYAVRTYGRTYGFDMPPEIAFDDPNLSGGMKRFYAENKRVSNALAKAELGWRPQYPTYREGLAAIYAVMSS
ncbi:SDR family oxidoreductase [Asticcacaulis sp. ZE23SCel15]|uniref:SDR family oxidoreductase n=1 Tax=Asticcacaulis sp. ZE23SCel15 TaxID=3059027 RepID=UPI00265FEE38|nr:SDR family oxidoreductase [Asticcacaulis sp. ZE23SCel15]WKL58527.1 SDR family oxidoreductase [Asticcacaulis sp. ZE23SCel15]